MSNENDERKGSGRSLADSALETGAWAAGQSAVERTLMAGIHGAPELGHEEKMRYLGEFRERVLKVLTRKQVAEPEVYDEIRSALSDPRADKLIVDATSPDRFNLKYEHLAAELGKQSTRRREPDFVGDIGLVVVSDRAVDLPDEAIGVKTREEKLTDKGLPKQLIDAVGQKICSACFTLLEEKAPEEKRRYRRMSLMDRMFGEKCPGHE
ncbi:YueI family protein [Gorillibacterium sp. CAU 1737]|uniref:YueI family protein n=1 Tax=Gorillibacterium sp. CAU 1737 TaxID=3140362 RepID=UPI0032615B6A